MTKSDIIFNILKIIFISNQFNQCFIYYLKNIIKLHIISKNLKNSIS